MRNVFFLLAILFAVACSSPSSSNTYDDEDIVAVVLGKEITVRDIRFLYRVTDEELPTFVKERFVKEEVVIQEAKRLGIDVSKEVEEGVTFFDKLPPKGENSPSIRKFVDDQAESLGMSPEEYYDIYMVKSTERSTYVNKYIETVLVDEWPKDEEKIENVTERIEEHFERLLVKYEDEIEIYIQ
ncbi:hypothetical protein [Salirhabdus salicampi]|uniref:hypothetical protein n=1 Tax=Salirhabdus salicampi TaxID=476102 RepID=UPI0020C356E2|nr:hypothetical protein [Salirhabdus salicampi]MCP8615858.1 hypothetical protein [Salirhabdus salicampi]